MNYAYIEEWSKFLNIKYDDCYTYNYRNVQIKFRTDKVSFENRSYLGTFDSKDYISITDLKSENEIIKYDSRFIFKIYRKFFDKSDDIIFEGRYSEKLIITILLKIISNYPDFMEQYLEDLKEIEDFNRCISCEYLNLSNPKKENFPIHKFKVYQLYSQSEKCESRVGRDNRFEIKEFKKWYVKFDDVIIMNDYVQSLLPENTNNDWSMYAYSATAIGETKRNFKFREDITEKFIEKFEIEKFINSINNSSNKTTANIG